MPQHRAEAPIDSHVVHECIRCVGYRVPGGLYRVERVAREPSTEAACVGWAARGQFAGSGSSQAAPRIVSDGLAAHRRNQHGSWLPRGSVPRGP